MVVRYLVILLALLLAGSIGAFLLYVPILTIVAAATITIGLVAMFLLGLCAGLRETE
jgi:hypothetical protein